MTRLSRIFVRAAAVALGLMSGACAAAAQPATDVTGPPWRPVVLDGLLDEWAVARDVAIAAPNGGPDGAHPWGADSLAAYARVTGVAVSQDADAVYLRLRLERTVALQALEGSLLLLLDADGDAASGWAEHGMRGVDAVLEFSPRGPAWGGGIGLRMDSAGAAPRTANEAGVIVAPSHAAREFEMRILRGGPVRFGERMTARFVTLGRDGGVLDALAPFGLDLADPPPRPVPLYPAFADPLARAPETDFRVVSWNVGREDMFQQPEAFGALLRPLAPDLLMLDEVAGGHGAEEIGALLDRILPGDLPWHVVYGVSGGSQRGVIATRGTAPRLVAPFDRPIPYPDSTRVLIAGDTAPGAAAWLRNRLGSNVPATGAIVEAGGRRLLGVTVDLEAGGAPGSARDRLRRMEALAIRDALAAAVRDGGMDGVLLAGDVNLVASPDPLAILSAGPDVDGSALAVPMPLRLDGTSTATWENPVEPFTPGRLDFVLVGDAALEVAGGFVFRAADLSPAWRERHGLQAESSRVTDHLPVVTDLRWRGR